MLPLKAIKAAAEAATPGPWEHDTRGYPHPDVRATSGRKVACTWGVNNQPKTKEACDAQKQVARANARRIVACVNACEGLSTEALEQAEPGEIVEWGKIAGRLPAMLAKRAELLAALQELVSAEDARQWGTFGTDVETPMQRARNVIARATEP